MSQKTDPDTLIDTFNAINLYSNMPHKLGKEAITFWIGKYPET